MGFIESFRAIDLLIYSQLILIYMYLRIKREVQHMNKDWSSKLFLFILYLLSAVNVLEGITWIIDGWHQPWARAVVYGANTLLLALNSLPAVAWISYADYKIFNDMSNLKYRLRWYLIPFYVSIVLVIVNFSNGIVFTVNADNHYIRGLGLYVIVLMTYGMISILYVRAQKYKAQIDSNLSQSIFLFMWVPIIAGIIQLAFYGVLVIWPAFIFATLIAFVQIENDTSRRDPVTGLDSRKHLEARVELLISRDKGFSIIMAGLNDFKAINDQYGHYEGDKALMTAAAILKNDVKIHDRVCRYGGDEFIILVESEDVLAGIRVKERIQQAFTTYNMKQIKPYSLSMSLGVSFKEPTASLTFEDMMREADGMMHREKERHKLKISNS